MDYHIDDAYGHVGDLGVNVGIEDLINFFENKDPIFQEFFDTGYTEDLPALRKALKGVSSKNKELNIDIKRFREIISKSKVIAVINDGCNDYSQFGSIDRGQECDLDIFNDFTYKDICSTTPPEKPGIFVIKLRVYGDDELDIFNDLNASFENIKWKRMRHSFLTRLDKIQTWCNCPILYIGSAGTSPKSRQTLASRYRDLAYCHPITFSLWALLHYNWKLDFGWKISDSPKKYADKSKKIYVKHHGQMPMLNEKEEDYPIVK